MPRLSLKLSVILAVLLGIGLIAGWFFSSRPKPTPPQPATFQMRNGDVFQASIDLDSIAMACPYGQIELAKSQIATIEPIGDSTTDIRLVTINGDRFSGNVALDGINVTLVSGGTLAMRPEMLTRVNLQPLAKTTSNEDFPDLLIMANGDAFRARLLSKALDVNAVYGELKLQWETIETLEITGGTDLTAKIEIRDQSGTLSGKLQTESVTVRLRSGQEAKLPLNQLRLLTLNAETTTMPPAFNTSSSAIPSDTGLKAQYEAEFHDSLDKGVAGPLMIVVPAGAFQMGSPESEKERSADETMHRVIIAKPFAVSKFEVSFAEYDLFAQATQRNAPKDQGWGRENRPVINISWHDAIAYTKWLSEQTNQQYRLLTEAEWEYVARAGSTTAFWWGNEFRDDFVKCQQCKEDSWRDWQTAPVGQYPANDFGLYDIIGSVWEWTCSRYVESYDGSEQRCADRKDQDVKAIRGGSYMNTPAKLRSAVRDSFSSIDSNELVGMRLARDL